VPTISLDHLNEAQARAFMIADNRLTENSVWDRRLLAEQFRTLAELELDFSLEVTGFEMAEIDLSIEGLDSPAAGDQDRADDLSVPAGPPVTHAGDVFELGENRVHCASALESTEKSLHFICMNWRHMTELLAAAREVYRQVINMCVWVKDNAGMGSFYRSQHELVGVFRNGGGAHRNNVQLGRFGRNRSNVWRYPCANSFSRTGDEGNLLSLHPTVKPVALVADAIVDCTSRNDIVLDGFLGSGTTVIAAQRTGRRCYGLEIDPLYVDTIVRRWQAFTRGEARHVPSGRSFREMEAEAEEKNA
jgi:hypothetical protein